MRISKNSNYTGSQYTKPEQILSSVNKDLVNLFLFSQGRVRFGDTTDGVKGENISGEFQVFACGAEGTTTVVNHTIGSIPTGFLYINQNGFGEAYIASSNTTFVTFATLGSAGTNYSVFLLK